MMTRPSFPLAAAAAVLLATAVHAQDDCDDPPTSIPSDQYCNSDADCDAGLVCGLIPDVVPFAGADRTRKMCHDYTAVVGERCGDYNVSAGMLPSPGCRPDFMCSDLDADKVEIDRTCIQRSIPLGAECDRFRSCGVQSPSGVSPACIDGKCAEFGYVGDCDENDKCPGGQPCWLIPTRFGSAKVCVNRASKGEPCLSQRVGPFNGYECQLSREFGARLACFYPPDRPFRPTHLGAIFSGFGTCHEIVSEGGSCAEGSIQKCDQGLKCQSDVCVRPA